MIERNWMERQNERKGVKMKETPHHPSVSWRAVVSMVEKERGRKKVTERKWRERERMREKERERKKPRNP